MYRWAESGSNEKPGLTWPGSFLPAAAGRCFPGRIFGGTVFCSKSDESGFDPCDRVAVVFEGSGVVQTREKSAVLAPEAHLAVEKEVDGFPVHVPANVARIGRERDVRFREDDFSLSLLRHTRPQFVVEPCQRPLRRCGGCGWKRGVACCEERQPDAVPTQRDPAVRTRR